MLMLLMLKADFSRTTFSAAGLNPAARIPTVCIRNGVIGGRDFQILET